MRGRILAALFLISLVPISVLGVQGYHCAMQAVTELTHKHILAIAHARSTSVRNWLEERTMDIATLAASPSTVDVLGRSSQGVSASLRNEATKILDSFETVNTSFERLTLYDRHWVIVAEETQPGHEDGHLLNEELKSEAESSDGAVLGVTHMHTGGSVGLHVACPVLENGKAIGFLVANLDFSKSLNPILQDRNGLHETGKVYFASKDMDILTNPFAGEKVALTGKKTNAAVLSGHQAHAPMVVTYQDYKGNQVLGTSVPIGFEEWSLLVEIDSDEALVWLKILLNRSLLTVLLTCLVVVCVAIWMSRLVTEPLKRLVRISHRIRAGHVEERLEEMEVLEADEVRRAFNAMLDELREQQDQLIKTATLAYVGELTSSTVHEMRNPLSSIKMNLQALCRAAELDAKHRELGEIALGQSRRLENMLTDLLSFGKPVDLNIQSLSFEDLAKATLEVVNDAVTQNGVAVEVEDLLDETTLHMDKEQMCRALTNLVRNALEAIPSGGQITLRAKRHSEESGQVEIAVLDSGPGLTSEALERAFQPFFTSKPDGTGLGLPNVKKIVDLHGGSLILENRPDGGAAAIMILPVAGKG